MARQKTIFVCHECGHSASGWLGKCPTCGCWGTFAEEASDAAGQKLPPGVRAGAGSAARGGGQAFGRGAGGAPEGAIACKLSEIQGDEGETRFATGIGELDRALGGGIVEGSLVLVGGDPGIGKSTLLLQMCSSIGAGASDVLYVSGEESPRQLKLRASRLGVSGGRVSVAAETNLAAIEGLVASLSPKVVVVDSIQTMHDGQSPAAPGSVTQIRGVTLALMRIAKTAGVAFLIVGHVTKGGEIAGPKVLEHMVDAVLYFEGERAAGFRILRAVKNRFGSTNEIGVFEMSDNGLVEVANPSAAMIGERPLGAPGSIVVPSVEGTRPMLVEIQALASRTGSPNPRRVSNGVDYNRTSLMAAILEKRAGLRLSERDVYVNVTGGVRLTETACDLGVVAAMASSYEDRAFEPGLALVGEVGLAGEVRAVGQIGARLAEAERLGFTRCAIPEGNHPQTQHAMEIIPVRHIMAIFDLMQ